MSAKPPLHTFHLIVTWQVIQLAVPQVWSLRSFVVPFADISVFLKLRSKTIPSGKELIGIFDKKKG